MQTYQLGPDELSGSDLDDLKSAGYEWFAYHYEIGSYEGDGIGIGKCIGGGYNVYNLGHCSCYGPLERATPDHINNEADLLSRCDFDPDINRKRLLSDYDRPRWNAIQQWLVTRPEFASAVPMQGESQ